MFAYRLIVRGRVQRVGFRRYVLEHARALGLKGNIRNEDDDSVHIHAQGDDENAFNKFIELIKNAPSPAYVSSVEIIPTQVEEHKSFKIVYGELGDELQEGFGAMQSVFEDYRQEFRAYVAEFRSFASRTDANFADLKQELRSFASRTDANFADLKQELRSFASRTDANFADLKQEVRSVRDEVKALADRTDANFAELKQEVRSVRDEVKALADRTDANFKVIEVKYGEISEKLTLILNELKKSNEETRADLTRAMNMLADILNRLIRLEEQRQQKQQQ
ncbi:MAG: acylphosphatase [Candidatus Nitrosocaldus sp.]